MNDITLTYYGKVTDTGELQLPGRRIRKEVAQFAGKEIELTIRRKRKRRSDPQNRYYFGVVVEMVRLGLEGTTGETFNADEAHEFLKSRFLEVLIIDKETGEEIGRMPGSTKKLTVQEFGEYIEKCCRFAAEYLGVNVPLPQ